MNVDFFLDGVEQFRRSHVDVQVSLPAVFGHDVLQVFGDIVLVKDTALVGLQRCHLDFDIACRSAHDFRFVKLVAVAFLDVEEVAALHAVERIVFSLDFHFHLEAEVAAGIVQRLDVFRREAHHEVLLGRVELAEFFGDVELFFKRRVREYFVSVEVGIPRVLYVVVSAYGNVGKEQEANQSLHFSASSFLNGGFVSLRDSLGSGMVSHEPMPSRHGFQ